MSKTNYDSDFCGSLPLAFINQIQPYGLLIITDPQYKIVQVSENIFSHLGKSPEDFINVDFSNLLLAEEQTILHNKMGANAQRTTFNFHIKDASANEQSYQALIHNKENYIIFECEKANDNKDSFLEVYQQIREASSMIQNANNFEDALKIAANELKRISGFEKVMIYKFDEQWNGHVVAEAMEPGMESYYGLRFPASDVPKQARDLYLKNPYRLIPDRDYAPTKLFPVINPATSGFSDLSDCNMRAVAKVHLEYLKNMNVASSMSTRIIKENALWGLIACHHRQAKFLSYDECSVFELLSGIISSKLSSMEVKSDLSTTTNQQKVQSKIVEDIYSESNLKNGLEKCNAEVMELLNCTGLAYVNGSNISSHGKCPPKDAIEKLIIWLQTKELSKVYATDSLSFEYDEAEAIIREASGLIALPIIAEQSEFILGFRQEVTQELSWGGNPDEAIQFEADKKTYHPRNSFSLWREEIKNTSLPFNKHEIYFANEFQRIALAYRIQQLKSH